MSRLSHRGGRLDGGVHEFSNPLSVAALSLAVHIHAGYSENCIRPRLSSFQHPLRKN